MSSSRSRSGSRASTPRRTARTTRTAATSRKPPTHRAASSALASSGAPWVRNGIDYGPARAALSELALWALDIAAHNVEDWPWARTRVENTRSAILGHFTGTSSREASVEDIVFTAQLLARIFEDDLGLDLSDALVILEALDLPVDVLPLGDRGRRARGGACSMSSAPAAPAAPIAPIAPMRRFKPMRTPPPPPLRLCDECGYIHEPGEHVRYRNAA